MSDYDFRGFSQSAKDPALQGSADYAFGESGFSIGAWASNVDFEQTMATSSSTSTRTTPARSTTRSRDHRRRHVLHVSRLRDDASATTRNLRRLQRRQLRFKQWYSITSMRPGASTRSTPKRTTRNRSARVLARVPRWVTRGDDWEDIERRSTTRCKATTPPALHALRQVHGHRRRAGSRVRRRQQRAALPGRCDDHVPLGRLIAAREEHISSAG